MSAWIGALVVGVLVLLAFWIRHTRASGFAFTLWVAASVAAAMFYPVVFLSWYGYPLTNLIVPLIQVIMFGMGTHLSVGDFTRILTYPRAVVIGLVLHFTIMPFMGKLTAILFASNPEVAAGMVLIGSAPSGAASNVISYLAKGNVALSVTITACSTLMAPVMTPLMTKLLAGTYINVPGVAMMLSILTMVILPVAAGLLVNWVLVHLGKGHSAFASIPKAIMRGLPFLSMFAICLILAIMVATSRDALLSGTFVAAIVAAAAMHNTAGYLLGYWGARATGLKEMEARTVAIEVGLQNAGMASGLALTVLKSPMAALPAVVFGPWMNMSGAVLASWWSNHPPEDQDRIETRKIPVVTREAV